MFKKISVLLVFITAFSTAQNLNSNSTGSFTYIPSGPLSDQPVEVYYHIPSGDITTMPFVFSFHGSGRDGDTHRDFWIDMANDNGFIVIAPEFSSNNYPGLGDNYLMGNVFDDGDNPTPGSRNPENEWTFSVIEPLFDAILNDISSTQTSYKAWGHSGGSQFLHRFLFFKPDSRLEVAVCSNAGWYTVPEAGVSFPYGIDNSELPESNIIHAFATKLIVHLGESDTNQNSSGLRHNTVVDNQQGLNRFVRGNYFFNTSQAEAEDIDVAFNWEIDTVPNVGHNAQQMANDALPHILSSGLGVENDDFINFQIGPNPTKNELHFDNSQANFSKIEVFNLSGQTVKIINNIKSNQKSIVFNELSHGIYILRFSNQMDSKIFRIIKN